MLILATSDVHSPENLQLFLESLNNVSTTPQLVVFAGDMVKRNNIVALRPIINAVKQKLPESKIISIFGNEEFLGYEELYMSVYKEITWLNDNYLKIELSGEELCIIGTRGALDKLTSWQQRKMPLLEKRYKELPGKIGKIARELRVSGCNKIILVSHYGVTYKNLSGEDPSIYPYLACSRFEHIMEEGLVDIIIHGHAHRGVIEVMNIHNVLVYNVSLPARRKLVLINT
ncbi:MAG: metallophosphoesterase [Desulfurococcaceae archaeon]|nr:metallophosphoesterase [Desulfurococcaceae archaeon]